MHEEYTVERMCKMIDDTGVRREGLARRLGPRTGRACLGGLVARRASSAAHTAQVLLYMISLGEDGTANQLDVVRELIYDVQPKHMRLDRLFENARIAQALKIHASSDVRDADIRSCNSSIKRCLC